METAKPEISQTPIPAGFAPVKPDDRGVVLAEGELSGHAHRILDATSAQLHRKAGNDFAVMEVFTKAPLQHEEHHDIPFDPERYGVTIKRQYSEDEQGWAPVAD